METNVVNKKKTAAKAKTTASARQQKKEAILRNINAAVNAVAKYSSGAAR